jgi:inner membrane protein
MEGLISLLGGLTAWHWAAIGILLLGTELVTGSTYLLWPAAGAFLAAALLALVPGIGWAAPILTFAASTTLLTVFGRRYVRGKWLQRGEAFGLNDPAKRLVGSRAVVAVDFVAGSGRVHLGDTVWAARSVDDLPLLVGAAVTVEACDGATVIVKPVG